MKRSELLKFKWILVLELAFAGAYLAITRGLFVIFLVSMGFGIEGISVVMLFSAFLAIVIGVLLYEKSSFITSRVKLKLVLFHGMERAMWFLIPLVNNPLFILTVYSLYMIFSFLVSTFMNFAIYGSLEENDVKDVLAKRSASGGASNILGFALGVFLLAFLQTEEKFIYIFFLGATIGLLSTFLIAFLDLSHLEGAPLPKAVEEPERVFSTSLFFVIFLIGGNLLGMVWTPYLMNSLNSPDYLAASINLIGTVSSIIASMVWNKKSLKTLRTSHVLNALNPLLIWLVPVPTLHLFISAFNSFTYTGANFLGNFLFAKYKKWFGAVRSSILLAVLGNLALVLAAPVGIVVKECYVAAFSMIFIVLVVSVLLTLFTIPEVAIIHEDVARTYSFILYRNSMIGYKVTVEISKETAFTTLRLFALTLVLATLYVIYRFLTIIMA